jgi:hypothetical protein
MKRRINPLFPILVGAALLIVGATARSASPQTLAGRQFETMRALAHYLDEVAQNAAAEAVETAHHGNSSEQRFMSSIQGFARRADRFHSRMDNYQTSPWDVDSEVRVLLRQARSVNSRLRAAHAFEETYDNWNGVLDVLGRMQRVMAGQIVDVPAAHAGLEDHDRDNAPFGHGSGVQHASGGSYAARLTGNRLERFRVLAHQLDTQAARVHADAERNVADYSNQGERFLGELHHFAEQSRDVHTRADADTVNPRDIGPMVAHLHEDARRVDREMRGARVFTQVWDEWTQVVRTLDEMNSLVR